VYMRAMHRASLKRARRAMGKSRPPKPRTVPRHQRESRRQSRRRAARRTPTRAQDPPADPDPSGRVGCNARQPVRGRAATSPRLGLSDRAHARFEASLSRRSRHNEVPGSSHRLPRSQATTDPSFADRLSTPTRVRNDLSGWRNGPTLLRDILPSVLAKLERARRRP
jgi:hypothetical protein